MKQIDLEPKHARRVVSFSPWLIWGSVAFWATFLALGVITGAVTVGQAMVGAGPGFMIGVALALAYRNQP